MCPSSSAWSSESEHEAPDDYDDDYIGPNGSDDDQGRGYVEDEAEYREEESS